MPEGLLSSTTSYNEVNTEQSCIINSIQKIDDISKLRCSFTFLKITPVSEKHCQQLLKPYLMKDALSAASQDPTSRTPVATT